MGIMESSTDLLWCLILSWLQFSLGLDLSRLTSPLGLIFLLLLAGVEVSNSMGTFTGVLTLRELGRLKTGDPSKFSFSGGSSTGIGCLKTPGEPKLGLD